MSAVTAGRHIALSRVDEAYRQLSTHCLVTCTTCRQNPRVACNEGARLRRAWSQARREARR